jgi:hypothetical protein
MSAAKKPRSSKKNYGDFISANDGKSNKNIQAPQLKLAK